MEFSEIIESINDFLNRSKDKLTSIFSKFLKLFATILDKIVNGLDDNHKFSRYFITITIISIIALLYILIEKFNLFKIKDTKYQVLLSILSIGIGILTFLFIIYRNNNKGDADDFYYTYKKKLIDKETSRFNENNFNNSLNNPLSKLLKYFFSTISFILIPIVIIIFILWLHTKYEISYKITQMILGTLIILTALGIIAKLFSIQPSSTGDGCNIKEGKDIDIEYIFCIIKNIIFFLPCFLVILADEFNKDLRLTPSSIYILLIIELILITLIFLLPLSYKYVNSLNKSDILSGEGPFYLNEKKTIGTYQNLNKNATVNLDRGLENKETDTESPDPNNFLNNILKDNKYLASFKDNPKFKKFFDSTDSTDSTDSKDSLFKDLNFNFKLLKNDLFDKYNIMAKYNNSTVYKNKFPYNYTYSISFYLYLNPQSNNTSLAYNEDAELFNYGFKPVIYYNGKSRELKIKSRTLSNKGDQLDLIYSTSDIKYQKWLYFVINYENNIIDIFIDGKLVTSKKDVSPYFMGDTVTIGQENGIHGSIKEIFYYDKVKPVNNIEFLHDLTKNKQ